MTSTLTLLLAPALAAGLPAHADAQVLRGPDTVVVQSGSLTLRGLLWRPDGPGPFPGVLFNHGTGWPPGTPSPHTPSVPPGRRDHEFEQEAAALGPLFVHHGYALLYLFRRGTELSADQGTYIADALDRELATRGEEARNRLQVRLLETDELSDALAGLAFLRTLPEVDPHRVAVVGVSFGASLAQLVAERDSSLKAAVEFSGSVIAWGRSAPLRARLLTAVSRATVPVFMVYAANDLSLAPGEAFAAEMKRLGKPHRLKIYPPIGTTPEDGHHFVRSGVAIWEPDVFAFLDEQIRR